VLYNSKQQGFSSSGVEVGDEFQNWEQLNVVGLRHQSLGGIDNGGDLCHCQCLRGHIQLEF
jgi:hypothetical protein